MSKASGSPASATRARRVTPESRISHMGRGWIYQARPQLRRATHRAQRACTCQLCKTVLLIFLPHGAHGRSTMSLSRASSRALPHRAICHPAPRSAPRRGGGRDRFGKMGSLVYTRVYCDARGNVGFREAAENDLFAPVADFFTPCARGPAEGEAERVG